MRMTDCKVFCWQQHLFCIQTASKMVDNTKINFNHVCFHTNRFYWGLYMMQVAVYRRDMPYANTSKSVLALDWPMGRPPSWWVRVIRLYSPPPSIR